MAQIPDHVTVSWGKNMFVSWFWENAASTLYRGEGFQRVWEQLPGWLTCWRAEMLSFWGVCRGGSFAIALYYTVARWNILGHPICHNVKNKRHTVKYAGFKFDDKQDMVTPVSLRLFSSPSVFLQQPLGGFSFTVDFNHLPNVEFPVNGIIWHIFAIIFLMCW